MSIPSRALPILLAAPLLAQPVDVGAHLAGQSAPILLILEPSGPERGQRCSDQDLARTEGCEDIRIWEVTPDAKNARRQAIHEAYRVHLGLPRAAWALLDGGGILVANGDRHLDAAGVQKLLATHPLKTPIRELETFLRRRPDHLEARDDLLERLRDRAARRTQLELGKEATRKPLSGTSGQKKLGPTDLLPAKELPAELDARIWGRTYQELSLAYRTGDWLRMNLSLSGSPFQLFIRPDRPLLEAASPLLKGLFRKHRPELLAELRRTPADDHLVRHWVWTSLILEEPLLPVFEDLRRPESHPGVRGDLSWPQPDVMEALIAEAERTEGWQRLAPTLVRNWHARAGYRQANRLNQSMLRAGSDIDIQEWKAIGRAAVQACLRCGREEDATGIVDGLREALDPKPLLAEAAALAKASGREDLAEAWANLEPRMALPEVFWGDYAVVRTRSGHAGVFMPLDRSDSDRGLGSGWSTGSVQSISLQGESIHGNEKAWRAFLRWPAGEARWALVHKTGKVEIEGVEPLDAAALTQEIARRGLKQPHLEQPAYARAEDPIREMESLIGVLSQWRMRWVQWSGGHLAQASRAPQEPSPEDTRRFREALEGECWMRPGIRGMDSVIELGPQQSLQVPQAWVESVARPWLDAVEEALVRTPQRDSLWNLWSQWRFLMPDRPLEPFLGRLERAPFADRPLSGVMASAWPPPKAVRALARSEGWDRLERWMRPAWDSVLAAQRPAPGRPPKTAEPWRIESGFRETGIYLAAALLGQGRGEDADRVLAEALQLGLKDRAQASRLASLAKQKALAERWGAVPKG